MNLLPTSIIRVFLSTLNINWDHMCAKLRSLKKRKWVWPPLLRVCVLKVSWSNPYPYKLIKFNISLSTAPSGLTNIYLFSTNILGIFLLHAYGIQGAPLVYKLTICLAPHTCERVRGRTSLTLTYNSPSKPRYVLTLLPNPSTKRCLFKTLTEWTFLVV